jgi:hypothetical protein
MFFPGGIGELVFRVRDRYLRWVATRLKIVVPSLLADRRVEPSLLGASAPEEETTTRPKTKRELAKAGERE